MSLDALSELMLQCYISCYLGYVYLWSIAVLAHIVLVWREGHWFISFVIFQRLSSRNRVLLLFFLLLLLLLLLFCDYYYYFYFYSSPFVGTHLEIPSLVSEKRHRLLRCVEALQLLWAVVVHPHRVANGGEEFVTIQVAVLQVRASNLQKRRRFDYV